MVISVDDLTVTQHDFRDDRQIQDMVDFVAKGGKFDLNSLSTYSGGKDLRLINIVRFENNRHFIHDGHHRVAAIYLGGRKLLHASEYQVTDWKYEDYMHANLDNRWFTPFDPRIEVRIGDLEDFKYRVRMKLSLSDKKTMEFILSNKERYARPRTVLTIQDMLRNL